MHCGKATVSSLVQYKSRLTTPWSDSGTQDLHMYGQIWRRQLIKNYRSVLCRITHLMLNCIGHCVVYVMFVCNTCKNISFHIDLKIKMTILVENEISNCVIYVYFYVYSCSSLCIGVGSISHNGLMFLILSHSPLRVRYITETSLRIHNKI